MKKREGHRILPNRVDEKGRPLCLIPVCNRKRVIGKNGQMRNYCKKHDFWDVKKYVNWSDLRNFCVARDRNTCKKCGYTTHKSQLIGDHIIPIALGGDEWDPKNVQTLCIDCDKIKTVQDQKDIAKARKQEKHGTLDNYKNKEIIK